MYCPNCGKEIPEDISANMEHTGSVVSWHGVKYFGYISAASAVACIILIFQKLISMPELRNILGKKVPQEYSLYGLMDNASNIFGKANVEKMELVFKGLFALGIVCAALLAYSLVVFVIKRTFVPNGGMAFVATIWLCVAIITFGLAMNAWAGEEVAKRVMSFEGPLVEFAWTLYLLAAFSVIGRVLTYLERRLTKKKRA